METATLPIRGIPAPYGQACMQCSKAKCKCILSEGNSRCERCLRLNRDCQPISRHRKPKPKRSSTSKTSRLEEKLDGIAQLLRAATQATHNGKLQEALEGLQEAQTSSKRCQMSFLPDPLEENEAVESIPSESVSSSTLINKVALGSSSYSSYQSTPSTSSPLFEISQSTAEEYFTTFRTYKARQFPFVYIPPNVTAQQFSEERPFLYLCIISTFFTSPAQQLILTERIKNEISQRIVFKAEKNIDLLLGLLVYPNWFTNHICNKPQTSIFMHLAMSMVFDLGLTRPPTREPHIMKTFGVLDCPPPPQDPVRTNEERRAVLGCFVLSSIVSIYYQRIDSLRWTPHMDECLQELAEHPETTIDEILVSQVKLQLITEKVAQITRRQNELEVGGGEKAPAAFYYKGLQTELDQIRKDLPQTCANDRFMLNAELTINEMAIHDNTLSNTVYSRIDKLYACLVAIKTWLDMFMQMPLIRYVDISYPTYAQLMHSLSALLKLTTLDDPAWDKGMVKNTVDVLLILEQLALAMEGVLEIAAIEKDGVESLFTKGARLFRAIKKSWEARIAAADGISMEEMQSFPESPLTFSDYMWLPDFLFPHDLSNL